MRMILVAETGSDIPPEVAERYGIQIVPMHVTFGNETRDDGAFPPEEVCTFYEKTGILPRTSGCSPEDFRKVFDSIHARWPEAHILYLAYSAVTTCSFQSANVAAEKRDYVTCLDTKSVSAAQMAVVVTLAQQLEAHPEWTLEQVLATAEDLIARARMCFTTQDMEYLRAGGRVNNATALAGKLLGIHPQIEIQDGRLLATKRLRGKMPAVVRRMTESFVTERHLEKDHLWLIRTPRLQEEIIRTVEETARRLGYANLTWVPSGGVITTHSGPNSFGVAGFAEAGAPAEPESRHGGRHRH